MDVQQQSEGIGFHLKSLRVRADQSIREACRAIGVKTPSAWKHYEDDVDRTSMPADIVIDLLRAWEGKGDPAITTEEILQLSPSLMQLFKDTGHHFNTSVDIERSNIKVRLKLEARCIEDVRVFMKKWSKFMESDDAE